MNHKERAIAALTLKTPDHVPTFELEFQIETEMFGRTFDYDRMGKTHFLSLSALEQSRTMHEFALHYVDLFVNQLEYSILPCPYQCDEARTIQAIQAVRQIIGDTAMIHCHGDGTFSIPDGDHMVDFAYRLTDDPAGLLSEADRIASEAIEHNKRMAAAGIDSFILCADYCYNANPFLSPDQFSVFIAPFLARIIAAAKEEGVYTIKHTDGNIMPILDQLVQCKPHALHSLDPQAGVDIRQVKALVGDKVCLCGNVNCALMQTGTAAEVIASAEYCLTYGKPGGGYMFCTSNVPFKGLPAERYRLILDVWKAMRQY